MKILGISDLHGKLLELNNLNEEIDLIIVSGDITDFGPVELAEKILNKLTSYNVPVLALPGNCDLPETVDIIEKSGTINIHNNAIEIKGIKICGFGGSNPTPFDTPFEFQEEEIYNSLKNIISKDTTILVTHAPPYNTKVDQIQSGDNVGSKSIRKIIEEYQPKVNICAHIHEARGIDQLGNTTIINTGPAFEGKVAVIDLDGEVNCKWIKIRW